MSARVKPTIEQTQRARSDAEKEACLEVGLLLGGQLLRRELELDAGLVRSVVLLRVAVASLALALGLGLHVWLRHALLLTVRHLAVHHTALLLLARVVLLLAGVVLLLLVVLLLRLGVSLLLLTVELSLHRLLLRALGAVRMGVAVIWRHRQTTGKHRTRTEQARGEAHCAAGCEFPGRAVSVWRLRAWQCGSTPCGCTQSPRNGMSHSGAALLGWCYRSFFFLSTE